MTEYGIFLITFFLVNIFTQLTVHTNNDSLHTELIIYKLSYFIRNLNIIRETCFHFMGEEGVNVSVLILIQRIGWPEMVFKISRIIGLIFPFLPSDTP